MSLIEDNKLIALYYGAKTNKTATTETMRNVIGRDEYWLPLFGIMKQDNLRFHKLWDHLIPVIQKIARDTGYTLVMNEGSCYWVNSGEYACDEQEFGGYESIEYIHEAVVEFIKWWQQKQNV